MLLNKTAYGACLLRGKPTTVFNGWPKSKAELDKKLEGVDPWTLHDLRRTFSSRPGGNWRGAGRCREAS